MDEWMKRMSFLLSVFSIRPAIHPAIHPAFGA